MATSVASRWCQSFLKLRGDGYALRCLSTSQPPLIEEKNYAWLKDLGLSAENPGLAGSSFRWQFVFVIEDVDLFSTALLEKMEKSMSQMS